MSYPPSFSVCLRDEFLLPRGPSAAQSTQSAAAGNSLGRGGRRQATASAAPVQTRQHLWRFK